MWFWLALAVFALAALLAKTAGAQTGPLYCDPLRVYYPTVPTCPVPWRGVAPSAPVYVPAFPQPISALPSTDPVKALQTDAYRQGGEDWRTLQAWIGSQTADRRVGADYWAANRSVAGHAPCADAASGDKFEFMAGCEEAKRRLGPIDDRRRNNPEYRAGFADAAKQLPIVPASPSTKPGPGGNSSHADNGSAASAGGIKTDLPADEREICDIVDRMLRDIKDADAGDNLSGNYLRRDIAASVSKMAIRSAQMRVFELMRVRNFIFNNWLATVDVITGVQEECYLNVKSCIVIDVHPLCSYEIKISLAVKTDPVQLELWSRKKLNDRVIISGSWAKAKYGNARRSTMAPDYPSTPDDMTLPHGFAQLFGGSQLYATNIQP